eukprot:CAMPEP_0172922160 /NCGR_PEP_ID=MMETSP1075-20121228/207297_1 /TAXON_ID=2916 /ORGANISM="Ceratium fusus, Strain PA161109" /LENGTH=206 /DNA_ID=CAMNT_0013782439 /DNA_START=194 /DNA_END=814 /DNA_ORIENTATION=-
MSDPTPDNPARPEIAQLLLQDKDVHDATAAVWAQMYAGAPESARKILTIQYATVGDTGLIISATSIGGEPVQLEVNTSADWSELAHSAKTALGLSLAPRLYDSKGRAFDLEEQVLTSVAVRVPVSSGVLDACVVHLSEKFRSSTEGAFCGDALSSILGHHVLASEVAEGREMKAVAAAECLAQLKRADADTSAEAIRAVLQTSIAE